MKLSLIQSTETPTTHDWQGNDERLLTFAASREKLYKTAKHSHVKMTGTSAGLNLEDSEALTNQKVARLMAADLGELVLLTGFDQFPSGFPTNEQTCLFKGVLGMYNGFLSGSTYPVLRLNHTVELFIVEAGGKPAASIIDVDSSAIQIHPATQAYVGREEIAKALEAIGPLALLIADEYLNH